VRKLQAASGTGVLFITHDFGVVAEIAHRVAVLRWGELVEMGPAAAVLQRPAARLHQDADRRRAHACAARPAPACRRTRRWCCGARS
jgi:peptide/nickel transport system ATP-binding protein